ncbi:monosaccharide ABC transporter ATP-binding protein (CUT2 family) [Rhodococcus sp. AG1013]|uniref:sugar ABC transporter ATP-binding protein n=1 Tax=Rhodococcus sp. AG1013 TaxID=2183996 RepID=UPI000E0CA073|nr:sugar ABC transporter ATP-binding protein [Rhodococcus sp. AG1013]RDI30287.1 monosaccharide ABC transporter ATP-binding protein (CUT2 family) [Rhodococcus sp. AG1013]
MTALEMAAITKTYPGQRALDNVDFAVAAGEIHALLGHNGSGKSTLIKVMSGYHLPDSGAGGYSVAGKPIRFGDVAGIRNAGMRFIHQDIGMVEGLTVLENLRLGVGNYDARRLGRIKWRRERELARRSLEELDLGHIDLDAPLSDLTAVERTEVAVARALGDQSSVTVLILDEATAAMPSEQVGNLFRLVRRLVERGVGVVYVTHRLEEVLEIADQVTVLRDGKVALRSRVADLTGAELARVIAGTELTPVRSPRNEGRVRGDTRLEFVDVVAGRELKGASFCVRAGEVVGIAGLTGSGVHEVVRLLQGGARVVSGEVRVEGRPVGRFGTRPMREHGVAVLPGERRLKAIFTMSVAENMTISRLRPLWRRGILSRRAERTEVLAGIDRFGIRPGDPDRPIELLSGGNAQKVFVLRWLRIDPRVLVLEEPTHGVDVGGSAEILRVVSESAARDGIAVLLCSSDTDDLAAACDRVLVFRDGSVQAELQEEEITRERIVGLCYAPS